MRKTPGALADEYRLKADAVRAIPIWHTCHINGDACYACNNARYAKALRDDADTLLDTFVCVTGQPARGNERKNDMATTDDDSTVSKEDAVALSLSYASLFGKAIGHARAVEFLLRNAVDAERRRRNDSSGYSHEFFAADVRAALASVSKMLDELDWGYRPDRQRLGCEHCNTMTGHDHERNCPANNNG